MSAAEEGKACTEALEALIDKHGMQHVLSAVGSICSEKAEHLRSAWGDRYGGSCWDRAARLLDRCANSKPVLTVSP